MSVSHIEQIIKGIEKLQERDDVAQKAQSDLDTMVRIHITQDEYLRRVQEEEHARIKSDQTKNNDRLLALEAFKSDLERKNEFIEESKVKEEREKKDQSWFRNKIHSIIYIAIGVFILGEKILPFLVKLLRGTNETRNP